MGKRAKNGVTARRTASEKDAGKWTELVEHCSANAEVKGSNPVETPKNFFRATSQLFKLRFNCDGHIFISFVFPQFT